MPKASHLQPSFSGGEFSPRVHGRVDNERYKTGAAKLQNYLPTTQGPIVRRPGKQYVSEVKDPSKPPAFVPFQFSQAQNYVLEFGDQYLRFYTKDARIGINTTIYQGMVSQPYGSSFPTFFSRDTDQLRVDELAVTFPYATAINSGVLEIRSPYLYPDVHNIKWAQKEDTLYLTCSSYPTFELNRYSNLHWDLKRVALQDGPYLPLNSYLSTGDQNNTTLVLNPPTLLPLPSDLGTRRILHDASTGPIILCSSTQNNGGIIRIKTATPHPFEDGQRVVVLGVVGTVEANNGTSSITTMSWPITRIDNMTVDLLGSTFANAYVGSGTIRPALFRAVGSSVTFQDVGRSVGVYNLNGNRTWGKIFSITDATRFTLVFDKNQPLFVGSSANLIAETWQLEPFFKDNYPSCATFHQDRLALAGAPFYPQRVDLSETSFYESFAASNSSLVSTDASAISFNLAANQLNKINWLKSDTQGLLAGSVSSEWSIAPNNQAAALTPTNVSAKQTSFFGSYDADAIQTGNATLYVERSQQAIRELNYFFQVDTFRSTNIMELADHLALPGLTKIVNQQGAIPVVWALTAEGELRSMSYSRDDSALKAGWAPHVIGGQRDSAGTPPVIKSMAVIPSSDGTFDQLWCAVQRFINGTSVVTVEQMNRVFDDKTGIENSKHLDCAGTYDNPITISGISQAGSAIVNASSHGLLDGDEVLIKKVVGMNSSFVDSMGVTFNSNLVNGRVFRVGSTSANNFFLQDINNGSSYVDSRDYSAYFSGGEVRKLVQTISGVTWLKNETVAVLADGKAHNPVTVNSAGVFTLEYKAAVVQVGYDYNSDGKTLRADAGSADGTSIGKLRRPYRAAFMVHNTGTLSIGPSFERLTPVNFQNIQPILADQAPPLFSGIVRESLQSEHNFEGQIAFRQNGGLPGMVQTITSMIEEIDV